MGLSRTQSDALKASLGLENDPSLYLKANLKFLLHGQGLGGRGEQGEGVH